MRDTLHTAFLSLSSAVGLALAMMVMSPVYAESLPVLHLQGSTTFQEKILTPNLGRIESESGVKLDVVGNKSIWGLIALLEGRADMAMISANLSSEIEAAKKTAPGLPFSQLQSFEVSRSRIAFAIHASNQVRNVSLEQIKRVLKGEIKNWNELGGVDLPIRVIATQDGGGTVVAVRTKLLNGEPISAPGAIRLESAKHVVKAVAQEPGALAIAQLGLVTKAGLPELVTDKEIQQELTFVTLGNPTDRMDAVIKATRVIAAEGQ